MPKLHFTDKSFGGRVYELVVEKTAVGRGDHNTLVILDDSVSLNHCEILVYGPEVIVRDHGSRNGTYVDGFRVVGQMPVQNNQTVRFGAVEARLELEHAGSGGTTTDITAVHEFGKVMRDRRRAQKRPVHPEARIEPSVTPAAAAQEQTVILPNPRATQKIAVVSAPEPAPTRPPSTRTQSSLIYVTIALAIAVVVLLWLLLR